MAKSLFPATEDNVTFVAGSAEEKAKIYYESCLDRNDTVELRGTKPMQDLIESVSPPAALVLLVVVAVAVAAAAFPRWLGGVVASDDGRLLTQQS